jgi:hypothetical protein
LCGVERFSSHAISDKPYNRARNIFGIPAIVALGCLMGYYGRVAMAPLAHETTLQDGTVTLEGKVAANR